MNIFGCDALAACAVFREVLYAFLPNTSRADLSHAHACIDVNEGYDYWSPYVTYALAFMQLLGVFYSLLAAFKNMFMIGIEFVYTPLTSSCTYLLSFSTRNTLTTYLHTHIPLCMHCTKIYLQWIFRAL